MRSMGTKQLARTMRVAVVVVTMVWLNGFDGLATARTPAQDSAETFVENAAETKHEPAEQSGAENESTENESDSPNVVVIFIDDLGYADIGAFGSTAYPTPRLDEMAAGGCVFTDFVASSAVCSASRAALLTGCYHNRVGFSGAIGPGSKIGLAESEVTLGELCQQQGYATACFGKWHLGTADVAFLPLQQGFDHYYGLPYSNDMWPQHPDYVDLPPDAAGRKRGYPELPLYEGNEIVDESVSGEDQAALTTDYTRRSVEFIDQSVAAGKPFLLYLPHSMVHVPLFVSEKFKDKSGAGLFGDVMMEVDWSVGEIMDAVRRNGVEKNTLVIFTSDNGPWLNYGDHAGSALPLREGKGTMWEGGYRVPTIMSWKGRIQAGSTCNEFCSTIDIFPTVAALIDAPLPTHKIDGLDLRPLMFGEPDAVSPHEAFYCYYGGGQLQAVRDARWKLVFPHQYRTLGGRAGGTGGRPVAYEHPTCELALYDLKTDIGETTDVMEDNPDVVVRLMQQAEAARNDLGDTLTERTGNGVRPAAMLEAAPAGG